MILFELMRLHIHRQTLSSIRLFRHGDLLILQLFHVFLSNLVQDFMSKHHTLFLLDPHAASLACLPQSTWMFDPHDFAPECAFANDF